MQIIQITATLRDVFPAVVRTLEVPADITLDRLHETLQAAFGWENVHLYRFSIGEPYQFGAERWVMSEFMDSPEDLPAEATTFAEALAYSGDTGLTYLYDYGDDWVHDISSAPPTAPDPSKSYPCLIDITGNCPPEDIGGPPGYGMFIQAMFDPRHPEHKNLKEWYGGPFNPDEPNKKALISNVAKLAKS